MILSLIIGNIKDFGEEVSNLRSGLDILINLVTEQTDRFDDLGRAEAMLEVDFQKGKSLKSAQYKVIKCFNKVGKVEEKIMVKKGEIAEQLSELGLRMLCEMKESATF